MITKEYYVTNKNKTTNVVMEVVTDYSGKGMFGEEISRKPYFVANRHGREYCYVLCYMLNGGARKHVNWVIDRIVVPNPKLAEQVKPAMTY